MFARLQCCFIPRLRFARLWARLSSRLTGSIPANLPSVLEHSHFFQQSLNSDSGCIMHFSENCQLCPVQCTISSGLIELKSDVRTNTPTSQLHGVIRFRLASKISYNEGGEI